MGKTSIVQSAVGVTEAFDLSISAGSFLKSRFWCFLSVCLSLLFLYTVLVSLESPGRQVGLCVCLWRILLCYLRWDGLPAVGVIIS